MASRRVLIVEDEWLIARDYAAVLERAGHAVVGPAATAAAAVALLDSESVDVALLDFQLRGETSRDVAQLLNEIGIPFIIATGHAEADLPVEFASGVIAPKPTDPRHLVALVDQLGS